MTTSETADRQDVAQVRAEFEAAWNDPRNTTYELPAVDVNDVLARRYAVAPPVRMTGDQLWDMEVRKAWDPLTYIPYVVSEGGSWGSVELPGGGRSHLRSSIQKAWLDDTRGRVLEEVVTDEPTRSIFFMGRAEMVGPDGETLHADPYQPLFHVEHGVGGTAGDPTNLWRIVLLTDGPDERFHAPFDAMVAAGVLPGFVEVYIERDLGSTLRER